MLAPYSASPRGRCLIDERRLVSDLGFVEVRVRRDIVRSNLAISGYHSATVFQIVTTESWSPFRRNGRSAQRASGDILLPTDQVVADSPNFPRKSPFDRFLLLVYFEALFSRHFFPRKQTTPTDSIKISESCSTTICQRNRACLPLQNRRVYRSTRR